MRNHFGRFDRFELGEGNSCNIWPAIAAAVAGAVASKAMESDTSGSAGGVSQGSNDAADFLLSEGQSIYDQGGFVPLPNEITLAGRDSVYDYATGDLPGLVDTAQTSWLEGLSGEISPYTQSLIDAAQQDLVQQYQREIMPGIANDAVGYGGYGGSRQGLAQGIAAEGLLESMGDVEAEMLNNAYNQSQEQQQAAWSVLNEMLGSGTVSGLLQQEVGGQYTEDERNQAANLEAYGDLVSPYASSVEQAQNSTSQNLLGGAATGYGLYNSLFNNSNAASASGNNVNALSGSDGLLGSQGATGTTSFGAFEY